MHWGSSTLFFGFVILLVGVVFFFLRRAWARRVPLILRTLGFKGLSVKPVEFWANVAIPLCGLFVVLGLVCVIFSLVS